MEITFHTHNTEGEERWKPYHQTQLNKVRILKIIKPNGATKTSSRRPKKQEVVVFNEHITSLPTL